MDRSVERAAGFAAVLAALALAVVALLARRTGLLVLPALMPLLALAGAIAALVFARARLARLAEGERRDRELELRERADAALFAAGAGSEPLTTGRSREQFERFAVPAMAPLLAAALGVWAWRLFRTLPWLTAQPKEHYLAAAFLGGMAFFLFVLARYLVGVSRLPGRSVLRGAGLAAGAACAAAALAAGAAVLAAAASPVFDRIGAGALVAATALLAVENAVSFLLALYSPRRRAALASAYESRLAALAVDPADWTRNIARALDYQFGFGLTDTWFGRFLRGALVPLITCQALALYLCSCLVFLGSEEQGIRERLGRPAPAGQVLDSGFHLKWPWPFEDIRRYPAKRILSTQIGFELAEATNRPATILWTVPHFKSEDQFLVPSHGSTNSPGAAVPVNLVSLNIPLEYRITNLHAYAYGFAAAGDAVRDVAYGVLTRALAGRDLFELLGRERLVVTDRLRAELQQEAERRGLGVEILFVGLQGVHPPVTVADSFQSVVGALEKREATILSARAYTNAIVPRAAAGAAKMGWEAEAYHLRRRLIAEAETAQFTNRLEAFHRSPEVFRARHYLDALAASLAGARKFIVDAPPSKEVYLFNFEEKKYPDLFDVGLPELSEQQRNPRP